MILTIFVGKLRAPHGQEPYEMLAALATRAEISNRECQGGAQRTVLDNGVMTKSDWDAVGRANYVSFTSYRKDGSPVATPIWIAPADGKLYFFSDTDAFKVKRVRRNPAVTLQPCNVRGTVTPGAPVVEGTARVLEFDDSPRVRKIINRKYWLLGRIGELGAKIARSPQASIAIEISPSPGA